MSISIPITNIEKINENFKLPIFYNEKKIILKNEIIHDLELVETIDPCNNSVFNKVFEPKDEFAVEIVKEMKSFYTTDVNFLEDSQKLLKTLKKLDDASNDYTKIIRDWNEIKNDTGFKQKYYYLEWAFCEFLNTSEPFLQFMSLYSLASPVLSFLVPIFILILPFFIIKMKGVNLTLSEYIEVLKTLAATHAIGRIFTHFNKVPLDQKIYIGISAVFYVVSIYQNVVTCYKFNQNMKNIHTYFENIREYSNRTILKMNNYLHFSSDLKTYSEFNESIKQNRDVLIEYVDKLSKISKYEYSFKKINQIGYILKCFYEFREHDKYNAAYLFSFGFNGYIDNLDTLIQKIERKQINFATFDKKKTSVKTKAKTNLFKNSYYASLINDNPVKNTIKLNKNLIITGPNASGKTTILKSTLINVIFSQQFGCGFYDSANLRPYKHIHSYLNIPDTSGRDSLFQAEARRCKEIIDIIQENPHDTHLCSFDELYSGTNPDEAVISSLAFMEYLVKIKNVDCLLTTHFIKVCKKLQKNKNIINYKMETIVNDNENDKNNKKDKINKKDKNNKNDQNDFRYTYLMKLGISEVRGGIKVLTDMNYPQEILDSTKTIKF